MPDFLVVGYQVVGITAVAGSHGRYFAECCVFVWSDRPGVSACCACKHSPKDLTKLPGMFDSCVQVGKHQLHQLHDEGLAPGKHIHVDGSSEDLLIGVLDQHSAQLHPSSIPAADAWFSLFGVVGLGESSLTLGPQASCVENGARRVPAMPRSRPQTSGSQCSHH